MTGSNKRKYSFWLLAIIVLLILGIVCGIYVGLHGIYKTKIETQASSISMNGDENTEKIANPQVRDISIPVYEDKRDYLDYFLQLHPHMDTLQAFPQYDETGLDVDTGDYIWQVNENDKTYYYYVKENHNWIYEKQKDIEDSFIEDVFSETKHSLFSDIFSWNIDGNLMIRDYSQKQYYMDWGIGNGERMIFDCRVVKEIQGEDGGDIYEVAVTHMGETEPFQVFEASSLRQDPFILEDFNADGFLDLTVIYCYGANGGCAQHYVWCPSQNCFQKTPEELEYYGTYYVDIESRTLYIHYHSSASEGEEVAYLWSGETDYQKVKSFSHSMHEDENGVQYLDVKIERYDQDKTTIISEYNYPEVEGDDRTEDIWDAFYVDFVWEKQVTVQQTNARYMLRYAQQTMPKTDDITQGYKGQLFIFNEDTSLVKCLTTEDAHQYKEISWADTNHNGDYELNIKYEDGSCKTYSENELFN